MKSIFYLLIIIIGIIKSSFFEELFLLFKLAKNINYHSIFLKSLFGLNSNNDNIRQIKKKISKYIEKSKFSSLKECLSALIENIHRKIIFIGN